MGLSLDHVHLEGRSGDTQSTKAGNIDLKKVKTTSYSNH